MGSEIGDTIDANELPNKGIGLGSHESSKNDLKGEGADDMRSEINDNDSEGDDDPDGEL